MEADTSGESTFGTSAMGGPANICYGWEPDIRPDSVNSGEPPARVTASAQHAGYFPGKVRRTNDHQAATLEHSGAVPRRRRAHGSAQAQNAKRQSHVIACSSRLGLGLFEILECVVTLGGHVNDRGVQRCFCLTNACKA